jgi:acetylcholinesterase
MVNAEWDGIVFGIMGCPFTPVHDGDFFPDSPATALARENFKKTKILLGTNLNEGMYFVLYYLTDIFKKKENIAISRKQFKDSVTELNPFVSPVGLHAIIYEYTWWMDPSNKSALIDAIDKMVGDYQFTCPVQEFAQRYAETFNDVYLYYFEHRASNHHWPSWTGVLHGDEIDYIFGTPLNDTFGFNDKEKQLSREMMTYWANFARTGNPNNFGNGSRTSTYWPIYSSYDKEFLSLNIYNKSIGNGVRSRKCAFWKSYLPSLLKLKTKEKTRCP